MSTTTHIDLPQIIRDAAKEQGVTQGQLAKAGGVSRQTVVAWLNGRNQINAASLARMMDLLGLRVTMAGNPPI